MNWGVFWIPALIITGLVFCSGCTQTQETTNNVAATVTVTPLKIATPTPTPIPAMTTTVPTRIITRAPTPEPVPTLEAIEPEWTQPPVIIPLAETDTTKINFTRFVDDDFMAQYPDDWAVVCETFILPSIQLYNKDIWQKEGRMVTFTSEDGLTKLLVSVYDLIAPGRNVYTYTPTIDSARRSVATLFPNTSSESSVYNYQYKKNEQGVFTSKYDVIFSPSSEYYPYTYTEETFITFNHMFNIDFIVNNGMALDDYRDLRYTMMKSVMTEGMQTRKWW